MKKKSANDIVTKTVLKKELNSLENRMGKRFATKDELRDEIDRLENRVRLMLESVVRDISEANRKDLDKFRTDIDPILKEVLASREERTILANQMSELLICT